MQDVITSRAIAMAGLDAQSLRSRFDTQQLGEPERRLVDRWRSRAQSGRDSNLENYRIYLAIDSAWDSGLRQTTQTLVGLIRDLSECSNEQSAVDTAKRYGLTHLVRKQTDPKTKKPTGREVLDLPVMYGVILSLPRSFTLMRVSRIVTERLQVPLMKYEPAIMSDENRLVCEVGTQRIETGNREFGYAEVFSECVQAAAMYGQQLQFISEEWYQEDDVYDDEATGQLATRVGKEGLRYVMPHPSRSYIDMDFPSWTLNHDSGVRYCGYWRVTKFGSIRQNDGYWNRDRISRSTMFSDPRWSAYFQTTGNRQMAIPYSNNWFSRADREQQLDRAVSYYSQSEDDQPVWVTEHFEKFNPRVEFQDERYPNVEMWFRIVLASDDTPIYVSAICDRPANVWLYEPVGNRSIQTSLMMELLPYGDHATNLMTQAIISLEQNGANLTLFDTDLLDPLDVRNIVENPNKKFYRKIQLLGFSGKKFMRAQTTTDALFKSFRFPQLDIANHIQVLHELVALMQRASGMSDQEVGSTATHEQSAEEIRTIHAATGHRSEYVAAWMDFTFEAWKRQVWSFYTQYGTADAVALLSPETIGEAQVAGFRFSTSRDGRVYVIAPMRAMRIEHFIAQRDGPNRIPWVTIGGQMLNFLNGMMASPLAGSIPPQQMADLVNAGLEALQFPRSFRLKLPELPEQAIPDVMQQYIQQQLKELAGQVEQYVDRQTKRAIAEYDAKEKEAEEAA